MGLSIQGYLNQAYTHYSYLAETAEQTLGSQVQLVINASDAVHNQAKLQITGATDAVHSQTDLTIAAATAYHMQVQSTIAAAFILNSQASLKIASTDAIHSQVNSKIVGATNIIHSQVDLVVAATYATHMQVLFTDLGQKSVHSQALLEIVNSSHATHMQWLFNYVLHENAGSYLEHPYLSTPYLANEEISAHMRSQVNLVTTQENAVHSQVDFDILSPANDYHTQVELVIAAATAIHSQAQLKIIDALKSTHSQVERVIATTKVINSQVLRHIVNALDAIHSQARLVFIQQIHSQATLVLYNTTNLRILDRFPSRGTSGTNWVASSTAPGDFSVNNVNNDIVEFVWRSNTGDIASVSLTCDTQVPQGIFLDTLAILGHNFTLSAVVTLQGTNDPTFSTIGTEMILDTTLNNMYYIAPILPTAGYRYWRFLIDDPTNLANFLQVGVIIFGSSIIFIGEDIVDQIKFTKKHFKDLIPTEGFTNVSNDRALKKVLGLTFKDLDFQKANYESLSALFDFARTSLKCLWIPTPRYPTRFALFGKLTQLPEEIHNDKGEEINYIDLSIEVDESL